jgi:pimeloyl-ACP methyl ester carboxylesterase
VSLIVGVHGIGQQLLGEETLKKDWLPALRDGLNRVDAKLDKDADFSCAFYGDLFRPKGAKALGLPPYTAADIQGWWEEEFVLALWEETARIEPELRGTGAKAKARAPRSAQWALRKLVSSRTLGWVGERALTAFVKQAGRYFDDPTLRQEIRKRAAKAIGADTKVVVGHSLGSVVAYEVLCAAPDSSVTTLVTLGSPLAIPRLFFDRLVPAPTKGVGNWPACLERWFNIADRGDVVALVKKLRGPFGDRVVDQPVHNGGSAHNVVPYLTADKTGEAIAAGLRA